MLLFVGTKAKKTNMIAVRRLIIFVAQILALLFIVVATLGGALFGDLMLNGVPVLGNFLVIQSNAGPISFFGALAGFFMSTMLAAVFFVFVEIAYNTRNPFNT